MSWAGLGPVRPAKQPSALGLLPCACVCLKHNPEAADFLLCFLAGAQRGRRTAGHGLRGHDLLRIS